MTEWLVDTLIASSALMALVLLVREPVRKFCGPVVAYSLWLLPALRMIMPPLTEVVERAPAVPNFSVTAEPVMSGIAPTVLPASVVVPAPASIIETLGGWTTIVFSLWLIVATLMLLRGIACYANQRRAILRTGVQLARLGSIRLIRSERVRGPAAFGIVDRVIVVPFDFDQRFSDRQRCLALEHELAHHRSGDLIANLIAFVLLCLQWFNPLAWAAHAAFRFDQEAACDSRVLDKAQTGERALYGAAIAKAASGRTLLFAGALDRPSTLSRRLKIMTASSTARYRAFGFGFIGAGLFLAVPLTASSTITYVDTPSGDQPGLLQQVTERIDDRRLDAGALESPTLSRAALALSPDNRPALALAASEPASAYSSIAPAALVAPTAPVAPAAILSSGLRVGPVLFAPGSVVRFKPVAAAPMVLAAGAYQQAGDRGLGTVTINGVTKRWEDVTPQERAKIRADLAEARQELARELAKLPADMAKMRADMAQFHNGEFQREMASARAEMQRALREIDAQKADLKAAGVDHEQIKAEIRRSLAEVEKIDVNKIVNDAMKSVDVAKIQAEMARAGRSIDEVEEQLNRADRRQ